MLHSWVCYRSKRQINLQPLFLRLFNIILIIFCIVSSFQSKSFLLYNCRIYNCSIFAHFTEIYFVELWFYTPYTTDIRHLWAFLDGYYILQRSSMLRSFSSYMYLCKCTDNLYVQYRELVSIVLTGILRHCHLKYTYLDCKKLFVDWWISLQLMHSIIKLVKSRIVVYGKIG